MNRQVVVNVTQEMIDRGQTFDVNKGRAMTCPLTIACQVVIPKCKFVLGGIGDKPAQCMYYFRKPICDLPKDVTVWMRQADDEYKDEEHRKGNTPSKMKPISFTLTLSGE